MKSNVYAKCKEESCGVILYASTTPDNICGHEYKLREVLAAKKECQYFRSTL